MVLAFGDSWLLICELYVFWKKAKSYWPVLFLRSFFFYEDCIKSSLGTKIDGDRDRTNWDKNPQLPNPRSTHKIIIKICGILVLDILYQVIIVQLTYFSYNLPKFTKLIFFWWFEMESGILIIFFKFL